MSYSDEAIFAVAKFFSKVGVNFFETRGSNDNGIDVYLEVTLEKNQSGIFFAGQVKGGKSFIKKTGNRCYVYDPSKKHVEHWLNFYLPVFLFVFDPEEDKVFWIDIQKYIMSNPQKNNEGYSFDFSKEGAELTKESALYIVNYAKARANQLTCTVKKAEYEYDLFLEISKKYKNENNYQNELELHKSEIAKWLKEKTISVLNQNITEKMINHIYYYYHGMGVIGALLGDHLVSNIFIEQGRFFVEEKNGEKKMLNTNKFDFDECIRYFERYIVEENRAGQIALKKNIEILINKRPVFSKESINIFIPTEPEPLHKLNESNQIPIEINDLLSTIIKEKKNVLFVGGNHSEKECIISALTSFFGHNEEVALVEDRRRISVKGIESKNFTANSNNRDVMLKQIQKGLILEPDRLIFDIGNFVSYKDSCLPELLGVFGKRKGCFATFPMRADIFDRGLIKGIDMITSRFENVTLSSVDVIITVEDLKDKGFINSIWANKKDTWENLHKRSISEIVKSLS
ncbi:Flp pilus assembly complex ATPase component TadA [Brevibacillus sp. HB1.3]|uniref:DUF4365 domain-containing protein n=1 Tax=Brevibacillus sp. HB1.3 TaxID=2738842 RepID=UPI0015559DEA|nr:DUF4365 domain-containing protein [Brevibacillus sp. HB1.3]NQF14978.1 Flp pilus assembly complex ATPase component TadA [Brevibacillus sp. HB1.3]